MALHQVPALAPELGAPAPRPRSTTTGPTAPAPARGPGPASAHRVALLFLDELVNFWAHLSLPLMNINGFIDFLNLAKKLVLTDYKNMN